MTLTIIFKHFLSEIKNELKIGVKKTLFIYDVYYVIWLQFRELVYLVCFDVWQLIMQINKSAHLINLSIFGFKSFK